MKKKQINISRFMGIIMVILVGIIVLNVMTSFMLLVEVNRSSRKSVDSLIEYSVNEMDSRLQDIDSAMAKLLLTNKNVMNITFEKDSMQLYNAKQDVYMNLQELQTQNGKEFKTFVYFQDMDTLIDGSRGTMPVKTYQAVLGGMKEHLVSLYADRRREDKNSTWNAVQIHDSYYIFNYKTYLNCYSCCFISVEDFTRMLGPAASEEQSYAVISKDGIPLNQVELLRQDGIYDEINAKWREVRQNPSVLIEDREITNCAFMTRFVMKNSRGLTNVVYMQIWIFVILFVVLLLALLIFYIAKRQIMNPMKFFSENLTRLKENNEEVFFEDYGVYELAQANQIFKDNIEQMKRFKVKLYEKELEKQKMELERQEMELEYLQLQINPHFYINCLNQIYGMSCIGDFDTIQKLSLCVSDYFRYIFQKKADYVSLEHELKHVNNYLEICKVRFDRKLEYHIEVKEDVSNIVVPPLLLHTFVENSMEHSMTSDYLNRLDVKVERINMENVEFVMIEITDDGEGFPQELLNQLQSGTLEVKSDGSGVGIRNAVYRLRYLYGERAKMRFFNGNHGGAVIKLCLPSEAHKASPPCCVQGKSEGGI